MTAGTDAAKEFVNEIRVKCGHRRIGKLKKGYMGSQTHCPVALGLEICGVQGVYAYLTTIYLIHRDGRCLAYKLPEAAQWMHDFDDGKYPELVIPPTPIKLKKPGERKATVIG